MAFIETIPEDDAEGAVAEIYDAMREQFGYLPNLVRVFSLRPEAYRGWLQLNGAIKAPDLRRYELATLAAARRLRSSYCALQHGKVLAQQFLSFVDDATSVTQLDIDRLRALGLSDAEIVDVVLAAAARCFFSKTLDALGVAPDAIYTELPEEFREELTVGRPIETA
jgi:alkylhydroperoxidase family enzyme